jgi:hypothetical protein
MGALGFDPRAALARIQAEAPQPDAPSISRISDFSSGPPETSQFRPAVPAERAGNRPALASRMRLPAWSDDTPPPPGAWCSCCGRHAPQAGGRWWSPRQPRDDGAGPARGWRCMTCHPPPPGCAVRVSQAYGRGAGGGHAIFRAFGPGPRPASPAANIAVSGGLNTRAPGRGAAGRKTRARVPARPVANRAIAPPHGATRRRKGIEMGMGNPPTPETRV